MKIIKWIGHPVVLISVFLLLIIEGENFGGFYLLYLVLALPHGAPYAVISVFGITSIVIGFNIQTQKVIHLKPFFYLIGFGLMLLSLIMFFAKGNKWATFQLTVPLASFVVFALCSFCFLLHSISLFFKWDQTKNNSLRTIS